MVDYALETHKTLASHHAPPMASIGKTAPPIDPVVIRLSFPPFAASFFECVHSNRVVDVNMELDLVGASFDASSFPKFLMDAAPNQQFSDTFSFV